MSWIVTPAIKSVEGIPWNQIPASLRWTPAQLTTALWLDAADSSTVTQSSGLISQVNDKSGNSRNFTASGDARPTYTSNGLNGLPVFTYSGSQSLTSTSAASTWNFLHQNGGAETIAVWKIGNTSDPNTLYGLWGTNGSTVTNQGMYQRWDGRAASNFNNVVIVAGRSAEPSITSFVDISANDVHAANAATILGASLDLGNAAPANKIRQVVNGTVLAGTNTSTGVGNTADASFTLQVGTAGNNTWSMVGYVAEFLVFNSKLSTTNRQLVEGYLAHKWGISANLPSGHPYKNGAPTI